MRAMYKNFGPLALVSATIALQLLAAWILGSVASSKSHIGLLVAASVVLSAIGLNLARFIIWGYVHRRYPLSHIYPLTALFFPCVLAMSYIHGDPITASQFAGTLLITLGAFSLSASGKTKGSEGG